MKCPMLLALSAAALLAGCHPFQKYQPTIRYPSLPEVSGRETTLDCEALEDALLKTDAVRWAMRQEGARLLTDSDLAARETGDAIIRPINCVMWFDCSVVWGDEGSHMLNQLDQRILALLELKQKRGCDPKATAMASISDLELGDEVRKLVALETRASIPVATRQEALAQRTRLLDAFRGTSR